MNRTVLNISLIFSIVIIFSGFSQRVDFPELKGPYLGQKPPGLIPEIFAPGIASTDKTELNSVFSPDGNEFYFTVERQDTLVIMCMKKENDIWKKPEVAPFSGKYNDGDMSISHDGFRFFFCSKRPFPGSNTPQANWFIWFMVRLKEGWNEPQLLDHSVNSGINHLYPTTTYKGTLYFQTRRDGNIGKSDVYRSRFINGSYTTPENLGSAINSKYSEGDILIAPDESFIIVTCFERPENLGKGDLYIGFLKTDGSWTELRNMGKKINTEHLEFCPMLSPDGKYLFFSSDRAGTSDLYWVDIKFLDQFKPDGLNK